MKEILTPKPIDPGARIGHVHLKVADLDRALKFYCGVLGFELQQRFGSQAAFISAIVGICFKRSQCGGLDGAVFPGGTDFSGTWSSVCPAEGAGSGRLQLASTPVSAGSSRARFCGEHFRATE